MPLKIVRNDITKMNTQAIVNTANTIIKIIVAFFSIYSMTYVFGMFF